MREHRRTTGPRSTHRFDPHAARVAATSAHAARRDGYTAAEHARAMDRLLADIIALGEDEPAGDDEEIREPKLRLTAPLRREDLLGPDRDPWTDRIVHHA